MVRKLIEKQPNNVDDIPYLQVFLGKVTTLEGESKIDMILQSNTILNQISSFEWYVVSCGFKNGLQKDMLKRVWTTSSKYA